MTRSVEALRNADDLLRSGDLEGARAALVETVRSQPSDERARMFLFQLLALLGEWDKAKLQLAALAQLAPEAQMLATAYGQAIDAEKERAKVFAGTARAHAHVASDWLEPLIDAIGHFAAGRIDDGEAAREAAFAAAPDTPGTLDGEAFDWIADADGRFGPAIELILGGRYGLIGYDAIDRIDSDGAANLYDAIWYPVRLSFRDGRPAAGLIPARYPGTEAHGSAAERLARATGWEDRAWGQAGVGQRIWTLSTGSDRELLSLRTLAFG